LPGPLQLGEIVQHLRERLPADAIVTNGAGNFAIWVNRYYRYRQFKSQLAPTSGAMGYALPAAIAAKSAHPERIVVAFAGDGDFLMTGQELATAVQHGLPVIVIVVNNGQYGTIRMHQERAYPARVHGTRLINPDFAAYARSFGAFGELVETTEQFAPAFERALAVGVTALLELRLPEDSFERRVDQRRNAGNVLLQAIGQTESPGDERALLVAHPDLSLWVAPHQHPQREVETDQRPRDHQRRAAARVAEDEQFFVLHGQPDAARTAPVVDAREDGQPLAARSFFQPPRRVGHRIGAELARNAFRRRSYGRCSHD
jgi:acetolactate synthase-1/2/3 large subunit